MTGRPELFHEMYGRYFKIVSALLKKRAAKGCLTLREMRDAAREMGYGQTHMTLLDLATGNAAKKSPSPKQALFDFDEGRKAYVTEIEPRRRPLSLLERRWLAAILRDPRIKLFVTGEEYAAAAELLKDAEPLFAEGDFYKFDGSMEPDPFESEAYRHVFKTILSALKEEKLLEIEYPDGDGREIKETVLPRRLEYSSRDDKFQLLSRTTGEQQAERAINVGEITAVRVADYDALSPEKTGAEAAATGPIVKTALIELTNERGAEERALLAFASFNANASAGEDKKIRVELSYLESDETELLDAILSFGPLIRVKSPRELVGRIRESVERQRKLFKERPESHPFSAEP